MELTGSEGHDVKSRVRSLVVPSMLLVVMATASGCTFLGSGGRVDTYTLGGASGASDATLGRRPTGWTADPTSPDPEFLAAVRAACEDNFSGEDLQPLLRADAMLQDQRGPDGAAFLWTGDSTAYCFLGRTSVGDLQSPFGAWRETVLAGPLALEGNEAGPPSMVTGAVDPAAAAVEIATASGLVLRATIGGGRFVAWWPGEDPVVTIRSLAADGTTLATIRP